ncbi:alpha/beta hydrolase family protein, partial [Steroidobacter sp.]|uniref:alpha/beta hydrolase family protein n=1 Tax=Steroidobacter sp. TaxID=1978227 RepID=UPI001A51E4CA
KGPERELRIRDLSTRRELRFPEVDDFYFSEGGGVVLVTGKSNSHALRWIDLNDGEATTIWQGRGLSSGVVFDESHRQVAFVVEEDSAEQPRRSFWRYRVGDERASMVADAQVMGLDTDLRLHAIRGFSKDGTQLLVDLQPADLLGQPHEDAVDVDVWSYTDERLQSQQLAELAAGKPGRSYAALLDIDKRALTRVEQVNETLGDRAFDPDLGEMALLERRAGNPDRGEYSWNAAAKLSTEIVFFRDGRRTAVVDGNLPLEGRPQLSPAGRFVVYFDPGRESFLSRDVVSGVVRDLGQGIDTSWYRFDAAWRPASWQRLRGIAGWLRDDAGVLIYDRYDLWLLDPKGVATPINLTNGYGGRHQIIFSVRSQVASRDRIFAPGERLILTAFDRVSKHSGFFARSLQGAADPQRLTMGSHAYHLPQGEGWMPIKAKHAHRYLVRRESARESPNFFATADFKRFTRLSDLHPERQYNGLDAQLLTWQRDDGVATQGILYTPEDFDPTRKYPVIFNYYELVTDGLHVHRPLQPLTTGCEINVMAYVSRGYVVMRPDIQYEIGRVRDSAVRAVISAAEQMKKLPWIDGARMGVQGCSFGGIATNSIVTSTGLFAAAASSSGMVDLISAYGGVWLPDPKAASAGASLQGLFETGQLRMNATLWERPDLYIDNSAIFHADKVSTPLLLMHTRDDVICPLANAVEFFTALRRLGKPAWLLQYNRGNHSLEGRSAEDFSVRLAQFFDHYLRDAPPPKWLTEGVPARLKGIETGLELQPSG